jgi:hypothetical protein
MAPYVHQAYRTLAALRGLRYGCLVGEVAREPGAALFDTSWRLDVALLEAVLRDPAFTDDAAPPAGDDVPKERGWWGRLTRRAT